MESFFFFLLKAARMNVIDRIQVSNLLALNNIAVLLASRTNK